MPSGIHGTTIFMLSKQVIMKGYDNGLATGIKF